MEDTRLIDIKDRIKAELTGESLADGGWDEEEIIGYIDAALMTYPEYIPIKVKKDIRKCIMNEIIGYDVISELLENDDITDIMVNGESDIFYERNGKIHRYGKCFSSSAKLFDIIQHIAAGHNRIVNESEPIVDVRLKDGSRVNIVLPPVAINGPVVTIRKFPKHDFTLEKLTEIGSITKEAADFLKKLVHARYNIFISGGTGTGKTTFLNALSNYIPSDERIVTIEDSAEIRIQGIENIVSLETRNANFEGNNEITMRDLIKSSLRMRPDRIIVGEVRGEETLDMLQAMNTGHEGSISTGHANSPADMIARIETLVLMASDMPLNAIRRQIGSALDILVHLGRIKDGKRKVLNISEVMYADDDIHLNLLYEYHAENGLVRTGNDMNDCSKLERYG